MLKFDHQGLVPAVILDDATGEVLMVAFMNQEALQKTRETGYTHFFSRSRNALWRKGEQSGHVQEVRSLFVNCEENSLLIRVLQSGPAACHEGYRSCYYRRLLPDDTYEIVSERLFDPASVYSSSLLQAPLLEENFSPVSVSQEMLHRLESEMRQLYGVYLYLRDHDLSEQSNTSRLLQERSQGYLVSRLGDELEELAGVQSGDHVHAGRASDTILEGSQVGYWLLLLAAGSNIPYNDFSPHLSLLQGYQGAFPEAKVIELRQECLNLVVSADNASVAHGLQLGFSLIGWACASAEITPLQPAEYDLDQMRRKGLV